MKRYILNLKKSLLVLFFVGIFTVVGNKAYAQDIIEIGLILQALLKLCESGDCADHLKCYEIKDPLKLNGTVDIETQQFGLEPGCKIKETKYFCAPAEKGEVKDKKGRRLDLLNVPSLQIFTDFICYKIECPGFSSEDDDNDDEDSADQFIPNQDVTDQFRSREISNFKPSLLCAPAVKVDCTTNVDCDDGNECTDDTCNTSTDHCMNPPTSCDDGDSCNGQETCDPVEGCLPGTPKDCDDNNDCTDDSCDPTSGECSSVNNNTNTCDDGNICTAGDKCINGNCLGKPDTAKCDDGNVCTDDSCDPGVVDGCVHTNNSVPCDDGNACTGDGTCSDGQCTPSPVAISCDDDNVCTVDSCDQATGCANAPIACPSPVAPAPTPTPGDGGGPGAPAPTPTPDGGGEARPTPTPKP